MFVAGTAVATDARARCRARKIRPVEFALQLTDGVTAGRLCKLRRTSSAAPQPAVPYACLSEFRTDLDAVTTEFKIIKIK